MPLGIGWKNLDNENIDETRIIGKSTLLMEINNGG